MKRPKNKEKSQIDSALVQKSPAPLPAGRPGAGYRALQLRQPNNRGGCTISPLAYLQV